MPEQKVMAITGTSRGLGRYLAEYYTREGFQVIGCSRHPSDFKDKHYRHFCLDISDEGKVKAMFMDMDKQFNRLDVLINNAAVHVVNYALLTPLKTVQETLNINVGGAFVCCCEAVKLMKRNAFGRIINFSSIAVPMGGEGSSVYSASKSALEQLSRVLAREVGPYGITVNTLGLSIVEETGMKNNLSEKVIAGVLGQTILKKKLSPQDVADIIDLVISEKSTQITGQTVYLGGI
ncbi:MAG: SDR family oxidoreductase [Candidatus Omnitrophota bacterium]|nr:SDR family oxidoreductase [Candidatus Omnitrophota bacterium]